MGKKQEKERERKRGREKERETAPIFVPVDIFPPFPRAADREVSYFTVFYLFIFLVPGSSSVFTNVSVDHWLHLMERVFAA